MMSTASVDISCVSQPLCSLLSPEHSKDKKNQQLNTPEIPNSGNMPLSQQLSPFSPVGFNEEDFTSILQLNTVEIELPTNSLCSKISELSVSEEILTDPLNISTTTEENMIDKWDNTSVINSKMNETFPHRGFELPDKDTTVETPEDDKDMWVFLDEDENEEPIQSAGFHSSKPNSPLSVLWLLENFELNPAKSLPRAFLYDSYTAVCIKNELEPINAAAFGKLLKSVFPGLKTRRLGVRGNSRYHYVGIYITKKSSLRTLLCNKTTKQQGLMYGDHGKRGRRITNTNCKDSLVVKIEEKEEEDASPQEYLGSRLDFLDKLFSDPRVDAYEIPESLDESEIAMFETSYEYHCKALIAAFEKFDLIGILIELKRFWRIKMLQPESFKVTGEFFIDYEQAMSKASLFKVCSLDETQDYIKIMDLSLYQCTMDILYPSYSRAMPKRMADQLRIFMKMLDTFFGRILQGYPKKLVDRKMHCLRTFIIMYSDHAKVNRMLRKAIPIIKEKNNFETLKSEINQCEAFKGLEKYVVVFLKPSAASLNNQLLLDFCNSVNSTRNISVQEWVNSAEDVVKKIVYESNREVLAGEVSKSICPFSFWKSASDQLVGALHMTNDDTEYVMFKDFLNWYDHLIKHLTEMHISRSDGFIVPILHHYSIVQKMDKENSLLDIPDLISEL